jgi:hypothetical protein
MKKVNNCPFCGSSVVTKSDFIEGLFLCENVGCHHIFKLQDAPDSDRTAFGTRKADLRVFNIESPRF